MNVLAIDPGHTESAYVLIDSDRRPLFFDKIPNPVLRDRLPCLAEETDIHHFAIEMIASYGMAVGAEVFDTCVWIGRFAETAEHLYHQPPVDLVTRLPVKVHHCHDSKAKDSNITRALVDRFAPGTSNYGKGTKANPGWFYGFKADVWQAYALAVYVADTQPSISAAAVPPPSRTAAADPTSVLSGSQGEGKPGNTDTPTLFEQEAS